MGWVVDGESVPWTGAWVRAIDTGAPAESLHGGAGNGIEGPACTLATRPVAGLHTGAAAPGPAGASSAPGANIAAINPYRQLRRPIGTLLHWAKTRPYVRRHRPAAETGPSVRA